MVHAEKKCAGVLAVVLSVLPAMVGADEGMWLMNQPPSALLEARYGFAPDGDWLEHVQKSCVLFGHGASASLVSPNGLLMTNHHVGFDQLQKLSTPERNLLADGFHAASRDLELRCEDLEVKILWSIEDVTDRVNRGVTPAHSAAEAAAARRGNIAQIETQAGDDTGLHCEVVTLYHGARYHLYNYKRYTDVRLVMAPEGEIAHFGGDTDNFEYPRFCLDVTFFRVYEDGKPLKPEHYLKWSRGGVSEGDLTFIVGHPWRTERLFTVDHLRFLRDVKFPTILHRLWRREVKTQTFSARSDEYALMARSDLGRAQNSRKAFTGMLAGLLDPELFRRKSEAESDLRSTVASTPEYKVKWRGAWARIAKAQKTHAEIYKRLSALEGRRNVFHSDLLAIATHVVRLAAEKPKPNTERLEEYTDAALDSLYLDLYSPAPIHDALEIARMESGLSSLAETFGADDPLVRRALAGQSPRARAEALVSGTKLKDVAVRRHLVESGLEAVRNSTDPLIRFAADLDPEARSLRKRYEDEVESVEHEAYAKIAAALFETRGAGVYPDATGSLRLSFGPVVGYEENGARVPAFTKFAGLYKRYEKRRAAPPFTLSDRWLEAKDRLDLDTPFNFVCTADIIGGNSGSPVIDRAGEVVGVVFDGNIQSLISDIAFNDRQGRAVSVDARAIIEALRKVYHAGALADELIGKR